MTRTLPGWAARLLDADASWARVLGEVPRHAFLPDLIWPQDEAGGYLTVDKRQDPDGWRRWADSNTAIVTQWDDGHHIGPAPGRMATSSASQPSLVAAMLADLDARPGHRVLDVGTGTGWTTALLAARTGAGNVVGIELDPAVADAARARLRAAGLDPLVVTGDGSAGWPQRAPYDRVQCTYAVRRIPPAWVGQTRPGGLIVAPWRTRLVHHGAVVRLTVAPDGTASGPFTRATEFMQARGEREEWVNPDDYIPPGAQAWPDGTIESVTTVRPVDLTDSPHGIAWIIAGLLVPDLAHTSSDDGDGARVDWFYSRGDLSWAVVYSGPAEAEVYQHGPRRLWDEVADSYRWWTAHGQPGHAEFGLTTGPAGERVWLRSPDRPLPAGQCSMTG